MALSFSKLKTGAWGIRGTGITIGVPLVVTKRDGSTTRAVASRILWTGEDGTQLAAVAEIPRRGASYQRQRRVAEQHSGDLRAVVDALVGELDVREPAT